MHSRLTSVVLFVGVLTGAIITCVVALVHGEGLVKSVLRGRGAGKG